MMHHLLLGLLIFIAAVLYSSVGHAGASGYLAAMALMDVEPAVMKPAALVLNVFVASIGTFRFWRAGHGSLRFLLPLVIGSMPFAFIGGALKVNGTLYKQLLGGVLLVAAAQMLWQSGMFTRKPNAMERPVRSLPLPFAVIIGAAIGLLSGMTGTGGGIFLSPVLLAFAFATPKRTAATSVAFILCNSLAGLAGHVASLQSLPMETGGWLIAAIIGGLIGSSLGATRFNNMTLRLLLAAVLLIAGAKLLMT